MSAPSPKPTVTIVTPSYNQGEFIRATIESVLAQDYPRLEYIVMDGGSSDQTSAIAAEYASRLTWISEKDRGQAHAINKGFGRAKGDIVAWLNSDDILLPGAVTRAVNAFADALRRDRRYLRRRLPDGPGGPTHAPVSRHRTVQFVEARLSVRLHPPAIRIFPPRRCGRGWLAG